MDTLPPGTEGCHGGRETMLAAARAAGKSDPLDRLLADYPRGPHDQPQSMCPAFGSLRVGLRMRRQRQQGTSQQQPLHAFASPG